MNLHGGEIAVESEEGRGTTFAVSIPLGAAHLPPDRVQATTPDQTATAGRAKAFVEEALRWIPSEDGRIAHSTQALRARCR